MSPEKQETQKQDEVAADASSEEQVKQEEGQQDEEQDAGKDNAAVEGAEQEQAQEEVIDEEGEPGDEELTPKSRDKVQSRIDGLIDRLVEKDKAITQLEERLAKLESGGGKQEKVWTKAEVLAILNDPEQQQYHAWAIDKLTDIKADEKMKGYESTLDAKGKKAESYFRACQDYPDMKDDRSALWALANKFYIEKNLDKDVDGQYTAAALAYAELSRGQKDDRRLMQKRLDKANAKKQLAGGTRKVLTTDQSILDKLEKAAIASGRSDSPEWRTYLKKMDEVKKKKGG